MIIIGFSSHGGFNKPQDHVESLMGSTCQLHYILGVILLVIHIPFA